MTVWPLDRLTVWALEVGQEHTLQRILEDVRHLGIDARVVEGQLLSASIGADNSTALLHRSIPVVISILRQLCQPHFLESHRDAAEAVGMGSRVAESLERPDGQQHYQLGLECIKSVVQSVHGALKDTAKETELLTQEKALLEGQCHHLQGHLATLAAQKDADALERQTRHALDSAQAELLSMASNGRVTCLESAADTLQRYTEMEQALTEAQREAAQSQRVQRDCEQQLALYQREVEIARSGDLLFHKERLTWTEELRQGHGEMLETLKRAAHLLTKILLQINSQDALWEENALRKMYATEVAAM